MRKTMYHTVIFIAMIFTVAFGDIDNANALSGSGGADTVRATETGDNAGNDADTGFVGSQLWEEYEQARTPGIGTTLANYSHAGYHYMEKPMPTVDESGYTYFNVTDYGAVPDDGKSDRVAVLQALDAAQENAGKTVLYFPQGRYHLNGMEDFGQRPLVITKSNLVVKGDGQHLTELYFEQPNFTDDLAHITFVPNFPYESYWRGDEVLSDIVSYPPRGGKVVEVKNPEKFKPDMVVNIDANLNTTTQSGKDYFAPHHSVPEGVRDVEDYFFELHQVDKIEGKKIHFKEPIHLHLNHMEKTLIRSIDNIIEASGIEDLTISGNYREQFKHHAGSRFGERFELVKFTDARNCWARNLRLKHYSIALKLFRGISNTIMNINLVGNTGHNSVGGKYSNGNLFAFIRENTQTHHGLGGEQSFNGAVFLRCNQYDGLEAHCGWPRASLYDLNKGGFEPRPGGAKFFPHHGKDLCFWNWDVTREGAIDFWPDGKRYGYFMPPVVAGLHGASFDIEDKNDDLLAYEHLGQKIDGVASLFEAQVNLRTGQVPAWLKEQSEAFETISRNSSVEIISPTDFSTTQDREITFEFDKHADFPSASVSSLELWVSQESIDHGFKKVASNDGWTDTMTYSPNETGTAIFKAIMINSRNEMEESSPITVFLGDPDQLVEQKAIGATCMSQDQRSTMYRKFVDVGGGEARDFPRNPAWIAYENGTPFHEVEEEFYLNQLKIYTEFGRNDLKPILEQSANVNEAMSLIDGNNATTIGNIYGYHGSMQQFDLGTDHHITKIELIWKESMTSKVKLEIQTSSNADAWYSVVNDEPLWDFGVQRIGETLAREDLPGSETKSVIYFPPRNCRYIRFLSQNIPNGKLAEVKFYGLIEAATQKEP